MRDRPISMNETPGLWLVLRGVYDYKGPFVATGAVGCFFASYAAAEAWTNAQPEPRASNGWSIVPVSGYGNEA